MTYRNVRLSTIERCVLWAMIIAGVVITATLAVNFLFLMGWL